MFSWTYREWVKKGNVWKLESEAFKKPIEIKIWYDNKELAEFNGEIERLDKSIKLLGKVYRPWDKLMSI